MTGVQRSYLKTLCEEAIEPGLAAVREDAAGTSQW
jgi:hypothetical protein